MAIRIGKGLRTKVRLFNKHTLRKIVIISNYKCNLRCKDCSNFIPYLEKKEQGFFDIDEIIKDLKILKEGANIRHIQIQGGEPLLHKDLDKLISYLRKYKITPKISIATNALMLLNDYHIDLFKKFSVQIRMSDYGLRNQKLDQIEKQCIENGIACKIHQQITKDKSWLDMGRGVHKDDRKVQTIFETCKKNDCYTLIEGKFTKCSRAYMGTKIKLHPDFPNDYINLRKTNNIKKVLRKFLLEKKFMECCRYCNGDTGNKIPAGIQL